MVIATSLRRPLRFPPADRELPAKKTGCSSVGMQIYSWTVSYGKVEAFSLFDRAERSQRYLDAFFIVPADVGFYLGDELFDCEG